MNSPLSNLEAAVAVEKGIEELNRFDKFDRFITLSTFYHVNRWKNGNNCLKCDFIINLRYLYVENFVNGCITNIEKLQNYCRTKYVSFFSLRIMLHSLAETESQNNTAIKEFEEKFDTVLSLRNVNNIKI